MSAADRLAKVVTEHSRLVIVLMLVATAGIGMGASNVEESTSLESLAVDSEAAQADTYIRENFSAIEGNTTTTLIAVRNADGNVLSRDSLLRTLHYQRALRNNETVNQTFADDQQTLGVGNAVAQAAMIVEYQERVRQGGGGAAGSIPFDDEASPTIDEQIEQLESMDDAEVEAVVARLLDADSDLPGSETARTLLPRTYEPGSTSAEARLVVLTQETAQPIRTGAAVSEPVSYGQLAARDIAHDRPGPETYLAFGHGLVTYQENVAIGDSLAIIGPLALLFVLTALSIAYRDLLDIVLGLVGVLVVVFWTFGIMGWLGIEFNQVMIAIPILLIGLSVDYALHVIMRYRETREEDGVDVRTAMSRSLSGVGPALVLVTFTTAIGFLANYTSPVTDLQKFGLITSAGIVATLFVFGALVPALKTEIDALLEGRGWDRSAPPFRSSGRLGGVLRGGSTLARRAPLVVLAFALVISAGGAYGATQIDTTFSSDAFIADPPAWTDELPSSLQPSEYFLRDNQDYIFSIFQSPDKQGYVLVEGDVTNPETLDRVALAESVAIGSDVTFIQPDGEPAVETPLSVMERAAQENETFNQTFYAADSDGDGVPDRDVERVYDAFYAAAPNLAERTIHRTEDGDYAALRLRVAVAGMADRTEVANEMEAVAEEFDASGVELTATATGRPVVAKAVTERLMTTVIQSLAVTLVAIFVLLAAIFRLREGSASLGAVTLVPVVCTVTWLLGTMTALDIPISLTTSLVGSISLGLGVDYAIHVSERFSHELSAGVDPVTALERTVVGTGGALLSSAATTAAGFGVLTFSLLPGLQQFGLVLAVGIVYSFLATVFVQPSLLVLWVKYGPAEIAQPEPANPTADD